MRLAGAGWLCSALLPANAHAAYRPQTGDLVFHASRSAQSRAIQLATGSRYSHVGLMVLRHGQPYVYEAAGRVKFTAWADWVARGADGHFVARRLKTPLTATQQQQLRAATARYLGRPYDLAFAWNDRELYCSELVWKLYANALHLRLAPLARLGDFDLSHPIVQAKLRERYHGVVPKNEPVISPAALLASPLLTPVGAEP